MVSDRQQLHASIRGRVQGVNFRSATQRAAARLHLTGWVCNRPDGSVEVVAEGARPALDELAAFLHMGPPAAAVREVALDWQPATGALTAFEVRW
ncbi:MAG: acylphosphatase [Anaerolineales bacterium]|nr:acylphosphatase [Anaerolineales bacterium]